jgi:hypothetical protein
MAVKYPKDAHGHSLAALPKGIFGFSKPPYFISFHLPVAVSK